MAEGIFKCEKCEKEFSSKEALEMHINSKHYEAPKGLEKMNKKRIRNWIFIVVILAVIIGVAYVLAFNSSNGDGKYDDFARCLTEKNVTMYGTWWCPHCKDQKKAFGDSFQYINYIECSTPDGKIELQVCIDANITGYPTWQFANGQRKDGFVSLKDLALAGNCTLP